jgi:phospholipid/cholesterol/gamma-HCH transport system ATP-binding protein
VAYPLRKRHDLEEARVAERVAEALDLVGLPGCAAMMPSELSGGMRKRVALARAVAPQPQVVLYDEPTTGLDPIATRRIDELIRSVRQRLAVTQVVVTHDLASAYLISDRLAMLEDGRIRCIEPVTAFRRSDDPTVRAFLGAMDAP